MNSDRRSQLAGILIFVAMLLVIIQAVGLDVSLVWSGSAYWGAALMLWPALGSRNRSQSIVLVSIGFCLILFAVFRGTEIQLSNLLTGNSLLISMLIAVSFLSLVSRPETSEQEKLPRGKRAVSSSLLAVHLFGSVINLSSVFIIGDRISHKLSLSKDQVIVLVRAFSAAAFWSPFFAAMAVALLYAPDLQIFKLWMVSMPLAACAIIITFWQISRQGSSRTSSFTGYPMHYAGLMLPVTLALFVFIIRYFNSQLSILSIITIMAPLLACSVVAFSKTKPASQLNHHVRTRLPKMANEIMLFQAASVLSFGLQLVSSDLNYWLPFHLFGATEASIVLATIIGLSLIGIHPIISIATIGPLLLPLEPNQTLLALVLLCGWGLGSGVGPLSGMNLSIQGRYGVDSFQIMRWNLLYTLAMCGLSVIGIFIMYYWIA